NVQTYYLTTQYPFWRGALCRRLVQTYPTVTSNDLAMDLIYNLSMRGKLTTLVLPVLLVIVIFSGARITRTAAHLANTRQLQDMVSLAKLGDPVIEALQRERARSAIVLSSAAGSSEEQQAKRTLDTQRSQTDDRLRSYRDGLDTLMADAEFDSAIASSLSRFEQQISGLSKLRTEVDNRSLNGADSAAQYTNLIMEVVNQVPLLVRRATDPELARQINAYFALTQAAEMAGRER